jgi:hypothetical protein
MNNNKHTIQYEFSGELKKRLINLMYAQNDLVFKSLQNEFPWSKYVLQKYSVEQKK